MKKLFIVIFLFCFNLHLIGEVLTDPIKIVNENDKEKSGINNRKQKFFRKDKTSIFFGAFMGADTLHNSKFSANNWRGEYVTPAGGSKFVGENYRESVNARNESYFAPGVEIGISDMSHNSFFNLVFAAFLSDYDVSNSVPAGYIRTIDPGDHYTQNRFIERAGTPGLNPVYAATEIFNQCDEIPGFTGKVKAKVGMNLSADIEIGRFVQPRFAIFMLGGVHVQRFKDNNESFSGFGFQAGAGFLYVITERACLKTSCIYKVSSRKNMAGLKLRVSSYLFSVGCRLFL